MALDGIYQWALCWMFRTAMVDDQSTPSRDCVIKNLTSAVKKVTAFLVYQGILRFQDALSFLERITHSVLHN
jgi:hypothetical protein